MEEEGPIVIKGSTIDSTHPNSMVLPTHELGKPKLAWSRTSQQLCDMSTSRLFHLHKRQPCLLESREPQPILSRQHELNLGIYAQSGLKHATSEDQQIKQGPLWTDPGLKIHRSEVLLAYENPVHYAGRQRVAHRASFSAFQRGPQSRALRMGFFCQSSLNPGSKDHRSGRLCLGSWPPLLRTSLAGIMLHNLVPAQVSSSQSFRTCRSVIPSSPSL